MEGLTHDDSSRLQDARRDISASAFCECVSNARLQFANYFISTVSQCRAPHHSVVSHSRHHFTHLHICPNSRPTLCGTSHVAGRSCPTSTTCCSTTKKRIHKPAPTALEITTRSTSFPSSACLDRPVWAPHEAAPQLLARCPDNLQEHNLVVSTTLQHQACRCWVWRRTSTVAQGR